MAPTCESEIVGSNHGSELVLAVQSSDQFENQLRGAAVEIAGGLIRQKHLRLGDEGTGECKTLLFAAGEFAGAVFGTGFKADLTQPAGSLLFRGR
jgi:hypothetical protein